MNRKTAYLYREERYSIELRRISANNSKENEENEHYFSTLKNNFFNDFLS